MGEGVTTLPSSLSQLSTMSSYDVVTVWTHAINSVRNVYYMGAGLRGRVYWLRCRFRVIDFL